MTGQLDQEKIIESALSAAKQGGTTLFGKENLSGIIVKEGHVGLTIEIDPALGSKAKEIKDSVEAAILDQTSALTATVMVTAHNKPAQEPAPAAQPPQQGAMHKPATHIIAVASGKGGVGKSTTSVNLALAMKAKGLTVGILDADIYGPSLPRLIGQNVKPQTKDKKLLPIEAWGLQTMSIGYLVEEAAPTIWRGPMVMSAIEQMLKDVAWEGLDVLIIDMPPGTGDAQLSLSQRAELAGAVIVSTPQDLALIDARKGLNMFLKVNVPVLGLIENMSHFICPSCGTQSDIFGHGGARQEAKALGMPFLGEIPLQMVIRETSDAGTPIVASAPDSPQAAIYLSIADQILAGLDAVKQTGPTITFQ